MDERGLLDLIIARLPNLLPVERIRLCESLSGESELARSSKEAVERIIGRVLPAFWDIDVIRLLAGRDAERARLRGINWVSWLSPAYPPMLREIYDPPLVLFFRGRLPNPETPVAAVVGTRRPGPRAAAQAFDIARDLSRQGVSVVSGLALGIDAMAHRGSLDGGMPAFAVLGSGVDEVYPSANRALAKRMLESGGGLLSEYPPGMGPRKWHFPARNRIISGLARGVVIVEAPQSSGALITARFAADQNRDLWVASAGLDEGGRCDCRGTAQLAADGARVIVRAADILREWNWENRENREAPDGNSAGMEDGGRALAASLARTLDIEL